jgi:hypothetical protein
VLDRDNEKSRSFSPDDKGVDFCEQGSISVNKESTHTGKMYNRQVQFFNMLIMAASCVLFLLLHDSEHNNSIDGLTSYLPTSSLDLREWSCGHLM